MRKTNRWKMVGMLTTGSMMFQLLGCISYENILFGFNTQLGSIPAQALYDATIGPLLDDLLGGGGDEAAAG